MTTLREKLLVALAGTILLSLTVVWDARTTTTIRDGTGHIRIEPCPAPDSYSTEVRPGPSLSCRNR
ncbi:hypothetical protein [Nitrospira sp. Nam80]